jgi:NADH-quinone oxidoreductase subunit L
MLEHAWIIPLIPAASFLAILLFGKRLPRRGSEIGIAALAAAFVLAVIVNVQWFNRVDDTEPEGESEEHAAQVVDSDTAPDNELALSAIEPTELRSASAQAEAVAAPATEARGVGSAERGTAAGGASSEAQDEHEEAPIEPVTTEWTWFRNGGIEIETGMLLDGPAVMMLFVVSLVSLLVHVYSTDYMQGDRRYTHFFAFLSLFTASMLGLVLSSTTLQLIIMWELVGLCSFVLIGHWWEEKANSDAANKAFIINRVGDVGLLIGVVILFFAAGQTFSILDINTAALAGDISNTALVVAAVSLVFAVMSKSGQFILHTWLPDAMAGPTPVSALIHAATMVVAGIYMVARLYGVFFAGFDIGTVGVNFLAVVGGVTVIGGAALAFVQYDIKRVLAYSTISQLGYMVLALGVGAWTAALFHLFTHAFFKAGLFLGSGSVSHAVHSFDLREMGGLRRFMPHTFRTFLISTAALIGIFPLAGFWSKDEILAGASQLGTGEADFTAFMVVGIVGAAMTAAYMTRAIYLTFYGEYRGHGQPHESGPRIVVPLWILAGLAIVAGFANFPNTRVLDFVPEDLGVRFEHFYQPVGAYFPSEVHGFGLPAFDISIAIVSMAVALGSIGLTYGWYWLQAGPHGLTQRSRLANTGYTLLVNKYYFDHLYTDTIAGGVKGPIARASYWFNQNVIDGVVNGIGRGATVVAQFVYDRIDQQAVDGTILGSATAARRSGQVLRQVTTGKVQQYGALLFAGAAAFAGALIIFV